MCKTVIQYMLGRGAKFSTTLFLLVLLAFSVIAQPQIEAVEDNQGNRFNFTVQQDMNGTITYGEGTQRYGRLISHLEIENNSEMEICVEKSDPNLKLNAWLGSSQSAHPANLGFEETNQNNCFQWNVNSTHVENNKLRLSVWSRDQDNNFTHTERSRSDFYVGLRYENVTVTEESSSGNTLSVFDNIVRWFKQLV